MFFSERRMSMKLEAVLTIAYVVIAFGSFTGVVTWALRRAGPDFPSKPEPASPAFERDIAAAPIKRAA